MKAAYGSLINWLMLNRQFLLAELYTVTLANGTVYRWTNGPSAINSGGLLHSSLGPLISRGKAKTSATLEVATMDVTLSGQVLLGSMLIGAAAARGAFDGARLKVNRLVMPTYGDGSLGEVYIFNGRVSTVTPGSSEVKLVVKHDLETLNSAWPRNLIQPGCPNTLFGSACGVYKPSYTYGILALAGSTTSQIRVTNGWPAGQWDMGVVTWDSGPNTGLSRTIKSADANWVYLSLPLPVAPNPGDSGRVWPGCDKTMATCQSKFNNIARFRGCPFVPKPEQVR